MIVCYKWHLEERCKERGYSLEEVMPCVVAQDGELWTVDADSPYYPRFTRPGHGFVLGQMPSREAAGFIDKVKNFATAAAGHVAAGMPMATDDEIIRRHDICLQCEHLQNNACSLCGCPVARTRGYVSKLSWADQECPAGKWGKQVR